MTGAVAPHLPRQAPIDAYGDGGFRFAGMSHRGSLLSLPRSMSAWPVETAAGLTSSTLAAILKHANELDFVLIGTGADPWPMPDRLKAPFRERHISIDAMPSGAAVRTYNVLLAEGRRVAAALIALR